MFVMRNHYPITVLTNAFDQVSHARNVWNIKETLLSTTQKSMKLIGQ